MSSLPVVGPWPNNTSGTTPRPSLERIDEIPLHELSEVEKLDVVALAQAILGERFVREGDPLTSADRTRQYLTVRLAPYESEVFAVIFLDNQHRVIAFEEMFRGTINGTDVHAREVVRSALAHNACAVILAHNHPSGYSQPSLGDKAVTRRLSKALGLIDVRVLDHFIVGESVFSFAEMGLM